MGLGKKMHGFPKSVGLFSLLSSQAISRFLVKSCSSTVMQILMSIPKILKIWKCLEDAEKKLAFSVKNIGNNSVLFPLQSINPSKKMKLNLTLVNIYVYVYVYSDEEKVPSRKTLQTQAQ